MNKKEEAYKIYERRLLSDNKHEVLSTLEEFRTKGEPYLLPIVLRVIQTSVVEEVVEKALLILRDIHVQECAGYIANALEKNDFGKHTARILASCWQSGLNYSEHLKVFAEAFLKGDYANSIEAFTVIEEVINGGGDIDKTIACRNYLIEHKSRVDIELLPLYQELLKVLDIRPAF